MNLEKLGMKKELALGYDAALPRVVDALKKEGFGILTEIDVRKTLAEKLGGSMPTREQMTALLAPKGNK